MARADAVIIVQKTEERCGGWGRVLIAWANGFLPRQEFIEYTQAQKVLRGIA